MMLSLVALFNGSFFYFCHNPNALSFITGVVVHKSALSHYRKSFLFVLRKTMKMMRAMKKLKFWSRKKKKKKSSFFIEHPPASPPCHYHHHCHYYPVEPSAPPLPSWLNYNQTQETISASDQFAPTAYLMASSSQAPFTTEDERPPELISSQNSTLEEEINAKNTSYQQYMVENPVYGVPLVVPPPVRSERDAGAFGCVFSFGAHLFRCVFPCFHIREAK